MQEKTIHIGINGFGRIGRSLVRLLQAHPNIRIQQINDIADIHTMAHLLKYDSIHGVFPHKVAHTETHLLIDDKEILYTSHKNLSEIAWGNLDIVIECTGKFKLRTDLKQHLKNGAKKVILSVPPLEDDIKTIVLGVNDELIEKTDEIISNASCTTNNAAPVLDIIHKLCGIDQAFISTVHSYTTDQSLHDQPHKDLRRARAAGQSIVPTTTGAAKALTKIFPDLSDAIGGAGIRVPVPNGSLSDITLNVHRPVSVEEINKAFEEAAQKELKGILEYTEDPIVSIDIVNNTHSCIYDAQMTSVIDKMVKVICWYDNEYGYASRLIDMLYRLDELGYE